MKPAFLNIFCYWQNSFMKRDKGGNFSKSPDRKPLFLLKVKIKQKPACRNKEYNKAFKHFHQSIMAYSRSWKNLHWPMIGEMLLIGKNGENVAYLGGPAKPGKFCDLSPLLNLEIVFPALKLTRNCYLNKIFFFMKTAILIKKWVSLSVLQTYCAC